MATIWVVLIAIGALSIGTMLGILVVGLCQTSDEDKD